MTDAKTVAELAAKLRKASDWCGDDLFSDAAALLAEQAERLEKQNYTYYGKDGKPVRARELENRNAELEAENARLRGALSRQGDNMAFVVNHVTLPHQYYEKFLVELEEDRAALTEGQGDE